MGKSIRQITKPRKIPCMVRRLIGQIVKNSIPEATGAPLLALLTISCVPLLLRKPARRPEFLADAAAWMICSANNWFGLWVSPKFESREPDEITKICEPFHLLEVTLATYAVLLFVSSRTRVVSSLGLNVVLTLYSSGVAGSPVVPLICVFVSPPKIRTSPVLRCWRKISTFTLHPARDLLGHRNGDLG